MGTTGQDTRRANGEAGKIVAFEYQSLGGEQAAPGWPGWNGDGGAPAPETRPAVPEAVQRVEAALRAEFDRRMAEEVRRAFEAGRERGRGEGRQAEHESQSAAREEQRRGAIELAAAIGQERDRYLHAVEREVVELALAVAARILRREAQMDPLLLTGAVRVALGQLCAGGQVRLRVPEADLGLWAESIKLMPKLAVKPLVVPGDGLRLGECLVECDLGSVDLGIRAQLGEIERGFFDRAAPRLDSATAQEAVP